MAQPFAPRTIVLRSADGRDFLRLNAIRHDAGYPSLEVRIEAKAKGFSGGSETWIDGFALKEFTVALRGFERTRQGALELHAMTADEFRLALRPTEPAGRLLAEFTISRTVRVGEGPVSVPLRLSGAFELDPGTIGEIAAGFELLASAVAA